MRVRLRLGALPGPLVFRPPLKRVYVIGISSGIIYARNRCGASSQLAQRNGLASLLRPKLVSRATGLEIYDELCCRINNPFFRKKLQLPGGQFTLASTTVTRILISHHGLPVDPHSSTCNSLTVEYTRPLPQTFITSRSAYLD
ncbi:MAG: hypothetical protein Q9222_003537 [Ikaeria aurantiellina]